MKLGFLYGGQGSQTVGMGREFYAQEPLFRQVYDHAPVDFDLRRLCLEGPEEELTRTRYTQCCLLAYQIGMTKLLARRGIVPQAAAGLSLGEYGALYGAQVLSEEEAFATVALRGRAMEAAADGLNCGMTAVLGLEREPLEEACRRAAGLGVVEICNDNCPGQLVISGEQEAVTAAGNYALELGAKRCMPLKVSGPFHTSLMVPAGDVLEAHFRQISFETPKFPVYFNCLGDTTAEVEKIPQLLVRQVQTGVRFADCIRAMVRDGVDVMVEIGPGKTLTGFVKKTAPQVRTYCIRSLEDLHTIAAALGGTNSEA